jgi:hypothetical protein
MHLKEWTLGLGKCINRLLFLMLLFYVDWPYFGNSFLLWNAIRLDVTEVLANVKTKMLFKQLRFQIDMLQPRTGIQVKL